MDRKKVKYISFRRSIEGSKHFFQCVQERGFKFLMGNTICGKMIHICINNTVGCKSARGVISWKWGTHCNYREVCVSCINNLERIVNYCGPLFNRKVPYYHPAGVRCSQPVRRGKRLMICSNISNDIGLSFCTTHRKAIIRHIHKYLVKDVSKIVFQFLATSDSVELKQ